MDCSASRIPYREAQRFPKIVLDYLDQAAELKPYYAHPPNLSGIQSAIEARKLFMTDRQLLVNVLKEQYERLPASSTVQKNIDLLSATSTFTVTTAHQNNLFTGPLFFVYKILHVIRLAEYFKTIYPDYSFVPVYYIGSEDAELEELNHIYQYEQKITWSTSQTGAVGRMKVDKELLKLIDLINGQLSVYPNGVETMDLVRHCYKEGQTIQEATFQFVHALFSSYGLVIVLPDNPALKSRMLAVFEEELFQPVSPLLAEKTAEGLDLAGYKAQVNPREINLFYLKDNIRERITRINNEESGSVFVVQNTNIQFTPAELKAKLEKHPENFSPNVILRGLYQETILPNIAFVGGGGELSYWLQLKSIFDHYQTPYPVLLLRNSMMLVEEKWDTLIRKLGFTPEDFFKPEEEIMKMLVTRHAGKRIELNGTLTETERLYAAISKQAREVDSTLEKHVEALRTKTIYRLKELEKKMLRAEKRKFSDERRQIHRIKEHLFPEGGLQERYENLLYYYARWGKDFINKLYEHSLAMEQEFVVLVEKQ